MNIVCLTPKKINISTRDLSCCEQLVLWSLRTWVMGLVRKIDVRDDLKRAYGHYKVAEAGRELDHFLYALTFGAKCKIDVRCPLRGSLSPDELTLMNTLAAYQAGQVSLANGMLRKYCADKYLMQARTHAVQFTGLILEQGHMRLSANRLTKAAAPSDPAENVTRLPSSLAI